MKIGLVLNMANNQWLIAKALRRSGVDAELIISTKDFGMAFPHWEEVEIPNLDPYAVKYSELAKYYALPNWVKLWNPTDALSPRNIIDLMYMAKDYDLLQLSVPSVIYLQSIGRRFIVHEAGWLRGMTIRNSATEKLARRGYSKAECIVMTNSDCYPMLHKIPYKKQVFIPFVIEVDRYKPMQIARKDDILTFFHPTRHVWDVKGNDMLLHAFAQFIHLGYTAKLRMIDWGIPDDLSRSKELVKTLGIEPNVEWINPVSKPTLIRLYNEADIVCDQYILDCYGTTAPEAMACGKPVLMSLDDESCKMCYGEVAPVLNARSVRQILEAMILLTDSNMCRKYGDAGRRYAIAHHNPEAVAEQYIALYQELLHQ